MTQIPTGSPEVGALIRARRTQAGLSQAQLAARLGYGPTTVGGWERGERDIGATDLLSAAAILGVAPSALLPGPGTTPDAPARPAGMYAVVQLPGYVEWEGWVSEETFAGAGVLVVRDSTGRVKTRISPAAFRQIIPCDPPPAPGPERLALAAAPPGPGLDGEEPPF